MQIKTTIKYHVTLVRMTITEKSTNNNAEEGMKKRQPSYIVGGQIIWYNDYGEEYGGFFRY